MCVAMAVGGSPAFSVEQVQLADEADRLARREARRVGAIPGIGIQFIPL